MSNRAIPFVDFVKSVGVKLTPAQRVFAKVAFDGVDPIDLYPNERALARKLFGPDVERIPAIARSTVVVVAGARSGKTYLGALRTLHLSLTAELSMLAPGEVGFALLVAADSRLTGQALQYIVGVIERTPALRRICSAQSNDGVTLRRPDGTTVKIVCVPAREAGLSLRGRTLIAVVFDECAFFYSNTGGDYAVTDTDLYNAVTPRVVPTGQVLLISTPWGEWGLLYEFYRSDFNRCQTAIVAHAATTTMRDDAHTLAIVERETKREPDNARREFGAEFANSESVFLPSELVDQAIDKGRDKSDRDAAYHYACTVDLAAKHDLAAVLVGHREMVYRSDGPPLDHLVVDAAQHWTPAKDGVLTAIKSAVGAKPTRMLDVSEIEVAIAGLSAIYRTNGIVGDQWGAAFIHAQLKARGVAFREASSHNAEQTRRAADLITYFRQGRIRLVDGNPELIAHLKQAVVRRLPGGLLRFEAPQRKGYHDDYLKCLMLLLDECTSLPAVSANVVRTIGNDGEDQYFIQHENGYREPALPPIGSPAWLRLAASNQKNGIHIEAIERWLQDSPGNQAAVDREREKMAAHRELNAVIARMRMV